MRRKLITIGLTAILLLGIAAVALGGESWATCHTFIGNNLAVRLCAWPGNEDQWPDMEKTLAIVSAVAAAYQVNDPMYATVVMPGGGPLRQRGYFGFFDPVTKSIWIHPDADVANDMRFYYTLGHELGHFILDVRGVPIEKHHCLLYSGNEMKVITALVRSWGGGDFDDPLRAAVSCQGENDYKSRG